MEKIIAELTKAIAEKTEECNRILKGQATDTDTHNSIYLPEIGGVLTDRELYIYHKASNSGLKIALQMVEDLGKPEEEDSLGTLVTNEECPTMLLIKFYGKEFTSYEDANKQLNIVRREDPDLDYSEFDIKVYLDGLMIDDVAIKISKDDQKSFKELVDSKVFSLRQA
ncbi:MAG TPA: hypothetical protein VIM51_01685 [Desulfosporosinus sp.]